MKFARSFFAGALVLLYFFIPASAALAQFTLPPTCTISANQTSVPPATSVTLKWNSFNSPGGTITTIGSVGPSGSANVIPVVPASRYVGTFTGPGGTGTCSVTVSVTGTGSAPSSGTGGTTNGSTVVSPATDTGGAAPTTDFTCSTGYTYQSVTGPNGTTGSCVPINQQTDTAPPTGLTQVTNNSVTVPVYSGSGSGGSVPQGQILVPCGLSNDPMQATACNLCDFGQLIQNVINFMIGLTIPIAIGMFAYAGFLYFSSGGDEEKIHHAHGIFKSVLIGFLVAISAWLIIQVLLSALVDGKFLGLNSWNTLQCSTNRPRDKSIGELFGGQASAPNTGGFAVSPATTPDPMAVYNACIAASSDTGGIGCTGLLPENYSIVGQGPKGGTTANLNFPVLQPDSNLENSYLKIQSNYGDQINAACANSTIPNCGTVVTSLIAAESSGNPTTGCNAFNSCGIMQLSAANGGTACASNDSACIGNQISKGVQYLNAQYTNSTFGGNVANALAAYNGGPSTTPGSSPSGKNPAMAPSVDCPGLYAWQCSTNPGGLVQTQRYVATICRSTYLQTQDATTCH